MINIKFEGALAERTGQDKMILYASTPRDAFGLLTANWPWLRMEMARGCYDITVDGKPLTADEARMEGSKEIVVTPALKGQGSAVAAVVGVFGGAIGPWGLVALDILGGLALTYVNYLISPRPEDPPEDPTNPSDLIGGQVPGLAEGNPVPLLYGERIINPPIISQSIFDKEEIQMGGI